MAISKRHHYIPRFLIQQFVDSDNKVWVYDKEKGKVWDIKQSSKSIFFEMNRNNFEVDGEMVDDLERIYGEADNLLSKNLKKVLSTDSEVKEDELLNLIFFVTLTKWRIPASDEKFCKYKDIPIEQLGATIRPVDRKMEVNEQKVNNIKEILASEEVNRILLAFQPLLREKTLEEIYKNCFTVSDFSDNKFPPLLGDVPIIETPNTGYETLGDFIFPLSTHKTLICKKGAEKYVPNKVLFYIQRNLTTFHLAEKYVVCKSKEQLLNVAKVYSGLLTEHKTHLLEYVFNTIGKPKVNPNNK